MSKSIEYQVEVTYHVKELNKGEKELWYYNVANKDTRLISKNEISRDDPEHPSNDFFHLFYSTESDCSDYINQEYLQHFFETGDNQYHFFMILNDVTKDIKRAFIVGYILENGLYIHTICSDKGYGAYLLNFFIEYAKFIGKKFVALHAISSVLGYYPKFGFEHKKDCSAAGFTIYNRLDKTRIPITLQNSMRNDDMIRFMMELEELGFGKSAEICKYTKNKEEFMRNQCGSNGYYMIRCL